MAIPSILKGRAFANDGRSRRLRDKRRETSDDLHMGPNKRIARVAPLRYQESYINPEAQWVCSPFRKSRWGHHHRWHLCFALKSRGLHLPLEPSLVKVTFKLFLPA